MQTPGGAADKTGASPVCVFAGASDMDFVRGPLPGMPPQHAHADGVEGAGPRQPHALGRLARCPHCLYDALRPPRHLLRGALEVSVPVKTWQGAAIGVLNKTFGILVLVLLLRL